jgi:imidazoleglycerol-phosphate dehydratase
MVDQLARHGGIEPRGPRHGRHEIDGHHTTEDLGIVLGRAVDQALGDRVGIRRYGHATLPMDEALCQVALDLSGRTYFVDRLALPKAKIGSFDVELAAVFFEGFARGAQCNLHVRKLEGDILHHVVECAFKCLARALRDAVRVEGTTLPSTKGTLLVSDVVALVDVGVGNLRSVQRALQAALGEGVNRDHQRRRGAGARRRRVVFPGQGAFGDCALALARGRRRARPGPSVITRREAAVPGDLPRALQVLFEGSDEAPGARGLGHPRRATCSASATGARRRRRRRGEGPSHGVEHRAQGEGGRYDRALDEGWFYFVHSYHASRADPSVIARAPTTGVDFAAAVARGERARGAVSP